MLNTKPSAIVRLRDARREAPAPGPQTATLGLSIEPLDVIEREMQAIGKSAQAEPPQALALAARTQPDTLVQQAAQLAAPIGTSSD